MVYQVFKRFLYKSDKPILVNFSGGAGSMGMDLGANAPAYAVSKVALNMMVRYYYIWPSFIFTYSSRRPINLQRRIQN